MPEDDAPPIREFADRGTIWLLGSRSLMDSLVSLAAKEIAGRLDFSRAERINRSFIADDLQKQETDIVFRVPYRDDSGEALIYILVEHQSEPDPIISWTVLHRMDLLWGQQCRSLMDANVARSRWRMSVVVPIVFYTGERRWTPPAGMTELVDAPEALLEFVPKHKILFLSLHGLEVEALENSGSALGWILRALQAVSASLEELSAVVKRVVSYLETLPEEQQGDWLRAMHFLLLLIRHNRPREERDKLYGIVLDGARHHREKVEEIVMTDAQWLLEEGRREGQREGQREGAVSEARKILLRLGSRQFGPADEGAQAAIAEMSSVERMEDLVERLRDFPDWNSLLSS